MGATVDMKLVQVGPHTFKVRPGDLDQFLAHHPAGVVLGGYETKEPLSHSDQEIDHVNAIIDRYPVLTNQQARAIVQAGYTLATMPLDERLMLIKGIGPATVERLLEEIG